MGDSHELQITPETSVGPAIRNPFESPNDYHRLLESLVPSPSGFTSCKTSGATPAKFNWSIEEMASLLPVHIDPEDIHQQSLFFSQSRTDTEIEEKRQNAIEQFFTKGIIVPSPWTASANKQSAKMNIGKSSTSPLVFEQPRPLKKSSVACQTALSLPMDFDLEKLLGEHYRSEESCDQVQESLSTSSLRRKLFLDGHGSGSDSSSPPSPERAGASPEERLLGGGRREGDPPSSPLSCGIAALTPSTGQFSSSPIQSGCRAHSLGSFASPLFPERSSPATFQSPTLSPIGPQALHTPLGTGHCDRKRLSFPTPDGASLDMDVNSNTESPNVEGCSPILCCSPHQLQDPPQSRPRPRTRCWTSPPLISPILISPILNLQENQQDNLRPPLPPMELDPSPSPGASVPRLGDLLVRQAEGPGVLEPVQMEEEAGGRAGVEEEEEGGATPARLTSSRMGSVSAAESSHMFVSLLAEGSCIPADSSSMQVDSGYNTYSVGAASLMDGTSSECHSRESFNTHLPDEAFPYTRHSRAKTLTHPPLSLPLH